MIVTFPFLKACLHGFFCFHALEDTKQKKLTPLDRATPLHVNRVLVGKQKHNVQKPNHLSRQFPWPRPWTAFMV